MAQDHAQSHGHASLLDDAIHFKSLMTTLSYCLSCLLQPRSSALRRSAAADTRDNLRRIPIRSDSIFLWYLVFGRETYAASMSAG